MKTSLKTFFIKLKNSLKAGVNAAIGTIVTEIIGPIFRTFKRLSSFIKQGISSIKEAIVYLKDKNNKNKPFSIKFAQVGKIIIAGIGGAAAIVLGEVFEKILMSVPFMQTPLPLLGSLANIVGIFLGSLISGLLVAIVLNFIDKFIANKQKEENGNAIIDCQNEIINTQRKLVCVKEKKLKIIEIILEIQLKKDMMNQIFL